MHWNHCSIMYNHNALQDQLTRNCYGGIHLHRQECAIYARSDPDSNHKPRVMMITVISGSMSRIFAGTSIWTTFPIYSCRAFRLELEAFETQPAFRFAWK